MHIKLRNCHIKSIAEILYNMPLKGKDSRMRTRFLIILQEYLERTLDREIKELINKYAKKDKDGNLLVMTNNGVEEFELEEFNVETYHSEYAELMNEEYVIVLDDSNREMIENVFHSLLNSELDLNGELAMVYDILCCQLEDIFK